uniref:AlNc14C281G10109 protein n=1 Tax=Albugo laibachii Nc14 TaxID=890382 RepID=F0WC54_9STRA|nr:AlNc14C55G4237 [Albugo laibachii Nc14]CCA25197.1 AlNc14C281G10109 [Albugo laibachii Nc14]|eukprot:CCA25197.1 AlNc14C281G10109 [Albugo laibachii Nc14]
MVMSAEILLWQTKLSISLNHVVISSVNILANQKKGYGQKQWLVCFTSDLRDTVALFSALHSFPAYCIHKMTVVAAPSVPKQRQRSYKIREKIGAIKAAREVGEREGAKQCSVPRRTLRDWLAKASEYDEFNGNVKKTTFGGQGRHELMPFTQELVIFM